MWYNLYIMEIINKDNNIVLKNVSDFELSHIFDCGQCFRFSKTGENTYTGVSFGKALTISKNGDDIVLHGTSSEDFENIWYNYLDLSRDYSKIKNRLSGDGCMDNAIKEGYGIRILNQDLFEVIISFIISQSNNIPRIKKIIETLCKTAGEKINYEGKTYYSFPSPEAILECDISLLHAGYRDKYITGAAKLVKDSPDFLDELKAASSKTAKKMLLSIYGIGNKVADCIMLFGLGRTDSFPVDVWMQRIMEQLYFKKKCTKSEISEYAAKKFGDLGGIAQQYLFYYALNHKNELNQEIGNGK